MQASTTVIDPSAKKIVFGKSPAVHKLPGNLSFRALQRANTEFYQSLPSHGKGTLTKNMIRYLLEEGFAFYRMIAAESTPTVYAGACPPSRRAEAGIIPVEPSPLRLENLEDQPKEVENIIKLIESRCRGSKNSRYASNHYAGKDPLDLLDHVVLYFHDKSFQLVEDRSLIERLIKTDAPNLLILPPELLIHPPAEVRADKKLLVHQVMSSDAHPTTTLKRCLTEENSEKSGPPKMPCRRQTTSRQVESSIVSQMMSLHSAAEAQVISLDHFDLPEETSLSLETTLQERASVGIEILETSDFLRGLSGYVNEELAHLAPPTSTLIPQ